MCWSWQAGGPPWLPQHVFSTPPLSSSGCAGEGPWGNSSFLTCKLSEIQLAALGANFKLDLWWEEALLQASVSKCSISLCEEECVLGWRLLVSSLSDSFPRRLPFLEFFVFFPFPPVSSPVFFLFQNKHSPLFWASFLVSCSLTPRSAPAWEVPAPCGPVGLPLGTRLLGEEMLLPLLGLCLWRLSVESLPKTMVGTGNQWITQAGIIWG